MLYLLFRNTHTFSSNSIIGSGLYFYAFLSLKSAKGKDLTPARGRLIIGRSKTEDWLEALNKAVNSIFPEGIREGGYEVPMLISDNGCQPASVRFMKECSALGIRQIFTSWSNPRGNADTERVIRTIKEDAVWPYEWDSIGELREALALWIGHYNADYPHSSLNYRTPVEYRMDYENTGNTKLFSS